MASSAKVARWQSYFVLLSLWTDLRYITHRVSRRLQRYLGARHAFHAVPLVHAPSRDSTPQQSASPGRRVASPPTLPATDVDLVYLWVHGQDPAHRAKRNHWRQQYGLDPEVTDPAERYVERDELRYSLRTAELFAPWARRVFLVTDRQVPSWLALDHPKIRLVDHSTFVKPEWLPTFNSNAIVAQLHRIDELSEHFIICDDDTFFGQPCGKADFFSLVRTRSGERAAMKVMLSDSDDDWIVPSHQLRGDRLAELWMDSWNNVKVALELRRPWRKVRHLDIHQLTPMLKSELRSSAVRFPREYERTCSNKFRSPDDVNFSSLTKYRCLQESTAERGDLPHAVFRSETQLAGYSSADLPTLFCINAGAGEVANGRRERELQRLFPAPSSFEAVRDAPRARTGG